MIREDADGLAIFEYEEARRGMLAGRQSELDAIVGACRGVGTLFVVGCGGSHAQAEHLVAELLGGMTPEGKRRPPIPAINLGADAAFLTAWSNDASFETAFARRLAVGNSRDTLLALSTSGRSPGVLAAIRVATDLGMITCAITGEAGSAEPVEYELRIPAKDTRTVQELSLVFLHELALRLGA